MATQRALTFQSVGLKQLVDADSLSVGVGIVPGAAGPLAIGATVATAVNIGAVAVPANALGDLSVAGVAYTNGGIDRSTAAALNIGGTNASAVNLGKVGALTTIKGDLQVDGTETVVGISTFNTAATFQGPVTFEGDATFGNAATDNVRFFSNIGDVTYPDFNFAKELNHVIRVATSTTSNAAGGYLDLRGGASNGSGVGGGLFLSGGSTTGAGNGGPVTIEGGAASGAGNGGNLTLNGGQGTADGAVVIGSVASGVTLGHLTNNVTVVGTLEKTVGAVELAATATSYLTSTAGLTLTGGAASTWSTSAGALTLTSAAAATWSTAAGVLTLNGAGGLLVQGGGVTALTVNSAGTTLAVNAKVGPSGTTDLVFVKELSHSIYVEDSTTTDTGGGDLSVLGGKGVGNGVGGWLTLLGGIAVGTGDAGSVSISGGANTGAGDAGDVTINGGLGTAAPQNGIVAIGTATNTEIGLLADPTKTLQIHGYLQPNLSEPDLIFQKGVSRAITIRGETTAAVGSSLTLRPGQGGTSDSKGGDIYVIGAQGGASNGDGGDAHVRGGAKNGTGADGVVYIGDLNTSGVSLGDGATAMNVTLTSGATLTTTGTGMINLPALFKIAGTAVGATVTAPNLDTLTNGSNADALHVHAGAAATSITFTKVADAALVAGNVLALIDNSGPKVAKADADGAGTLAYAVGFVTANVAGAGTATVYTAGEISIPDAVWDAVPATTDVGKRVYMSATAGNVTITPPSASGDTVQKVGIVSVGGTGAVKIVIQIGDGVVLA